MCPDVSECVRHCVCLCVCVCARVCVWFACARAAVLSGSVALPDVHLVQHGLWKIECTVVAVIAQ